MPAGSRITAQQTENGEDTSPAADGGNVSGSADDAPAASTGDRSRKGDAEGAAGFKEEQQYLQKLSQKNTEWG